VRIKLQHAATATPFNGKVKDVDTGTDGKHGGKVAIPEALESNDLKRF